MQERAQDKQAVARFSKEEDRFVLKKLLFCILVRQSSFLLKIHDRSKQSQGKAVSVYFSLVIQ